MKKIVLTGGGTAGHAIPNLALVPYLKEASYDILYIGSKDGIEKGVVENASIPYKGISSGRLRRYITVKNLSDPFRVIKGYSEAKKILKAYKPDIVFSKGGFVSVPVVCAAKKLGIPALTHESDFSLGLANKINLKSVKKLCVNFPETAKEYGDIAVVTGCPIRKELFEGSRQKGEAFTGFNDKKPILLVMGGSLGAVAVNRVIRNILDELLEKYQIVHICGKGNVDATFDREGYKQYEFISDEIADIFALSDIVVSRAGANAICELKELNKPALLIPLPSESSRGDQLLNAESFKKQGFADVLLQENITNEILSQKINELYDARDKYIEAMQKANKSNASKIIFELIEKYAKEI